MVHEPFERRHCHLLRADADCQRSPKYDVTAWYSLVGNVVLKINQHERFGRELFWGTSFWFKPLKFIWWGSGRLPWRKPSDGWHPRVSVPTQARFIHQRIYWVWCKVSLYGRFKQRQRCWWWTCSPSSEQFELVSLIHFLVNFVYAFVY